MCSDCDGSPSVRGQGPLRGRGRGRGRGGGRSRRERVAACAPGGVTGRADGADCADRLPAPADDGETTAAQKSKKPRSIVFAKMPPSYRRTRGDEAIATHLYHAFRGTNVCTFVPHISSAPFFWVMILLLLFLQKQSLKGLLLRLTEFILPPPHPSVKEMYPRGDLSYDQIHLRLVKAPKACSVPSVGTLKHSFFGLSQPKSKCFTPPWGPEIFACGNLNEHRTQRGYPLHPWTSTSAWPSGALTSDCSSHQRTVRLGGANVDFRVSRSACAPVGAAPARAPTSR
jgi:hypothetical protein